MNPLKKLGRSRTMFLLSGLAGGYVIHHLDYGWMHTILIIVSVIQLVAAITEDQQP